MYEEISEDSNSPESKNDRQRVVNVMAEFFTTGLGSDFTVAAYTDLKRKTDLREMKLHKTALKQIPFFKKIFENDCEENRMGRVTLHDVEFAIVQEMMRFLYTAKIDNFNDIAFDLMIAADFVSIIH